MLNRQELEKLIIERIPGVYNPVGMGEILYTIENADPTVREKIETYLSTGEEPSMEVEGYTYAQLRNERKMNPIAALLTLNFLIKQPEKAKASLSKGSDHVGHNADVDLFNKTLVDLVKELYGALGPQDLSAELNVDFTFDELQRITRIENLTVGGYPKMPSPELIEKLNVVSQNLLKLPEKFKLKTCNLKVVDGKFSISPTYLN